MSDEELCKGLRLLCFIPTTQAADRIEALTEQLKTVLDREAATTARYDAKLETLTEQLEAARADAKEAEAYAEELERDLKTCRMAQAVMDNTVAKLEQKLATCEKYRDAYAECDRIGTQAVRDLGAKLAKAVEALRYYAVEAMPWDADDSLIARVALAEIEGEKT